MNTFSPLLSSPLALPSKKYFILGSQEPGKFPGVKVSQQSSMKQLEPMQREERCCLQLREFPKDLFKMTAVCL